AKGLELVRKNTHPACNDQPARWRVVIGVGIGGELALAQHRPRLLHIYSLVSDVERIEEQVVAMRDRPCDQRNQQHDTFERSPAVAHASIWLLRARCILAPLAQSFLTSAFRW